MRGVEHRDVQLIMDNTQGIKCLPGFQDNSDQRTAGFDAQSTQHPTAAEMPAEISLEGRRGNRKNQAKLCSELLNPAELDFYLGFGSSTWETGEIQIYCTIQAS